IPLSVGEIEAEIASLESQIKTAVPPPGLHTLDLYHRDQTLSELRRIMTTKKDLLRAILERIRQRVHDFLTQTERELVYGQANADIFERNRQYVDARIRVIAPEV